MAITALALLKVDSFSLAPETGMRAEPLEDAVLLHTGMPFASEPEELAAKLQEVLGDVLDEHEDPRGIFVLPDVANAQGAQLSRRAR